MFGLDDYYPYNGLLIIARFEANLRLTYYVYELDYLMWHFNFILNFKQMKYSKRE